MGTMTHPDVEGGYENDVVKVGCSCGWSSEEVPTPTEAYAQFATHLEQVLPTGVPGVPE